MMKRIKQFILIIILIVLITNLSTVVFAADPSDDNYLEDYILSLLMDFQVKKVWDGSMPDDAEVVFDLYCKRHMLNHDLDESDEFELCYQMFGLDDKPQIVDGFVEVDFGPITYDPTTEWQGWKNLFPGRFDFFYPFQQTFEYQVREKCILKSTGEPCPCTTDIDMEGHYTIIHPDDTVDKGYYIATITNHCPSGFDDYDWDWELPRTGFNTSP